MRNFSFALNFLTLIPALVKAVEALHGKGNGAEKKAAVLNVAGSLLASGGAAVAANNPAYAAAIGAVIDSTVSMLNASGQMPTPEPAPEPTPAP